MNSTIGSYQIDYVNFRAGQGDRMGFYTEKMQPGIKFGRTSPG